MCWPRWWDPDACPVCGNSRSETAAAAAFLESTLFTLIGISVSGGLLLASLLMQHMRARVTHSCCLAAVLQSSTASSPGLMPTALAPTMWPTLLEHQSVSHKRKHTCATVAGLNRPHCTGPSCPCDIWHPEQQLTPNASACAVHPMPRRLPHAVHVVGLCNCCCI
jgi:hypothetical protein